MSIADSRCCYNCGLTLTHSNKSKEHIIPNSCGGKLKSSWLICNTCNNNFGGDFDAELAQTINVLANQLLINRDRGEPQNIYLKQKTTEKEYVINSKGNVFLRKPDIKQRVENGVTYLSIEAPNEAVLNSILDGIKRKNPKVDIEKAITSIQNKREYLNQSLKGGFSIGGKGTFKSILKVAINYFIYCGGKPFYIKHLLPYLNGEKELDVVWLHYPDTDVYQPQINEASHLLKLVGNSKEKILYCYIELFNCHCYIVKLSENYKGKEIDSTYLYDLIEKNELDLNIKLNFNREELLNLFLNKNVNPYLKIQEKVQRIGRVSQKRQMKRQLAKIYDEEFEKFKSKYSGEKEITLEMRKEFADNLIKTLTPFIANLFPNEEDEFLNFDQSAN